MPRRRGGIKLKRYHYKQIVGYKPDLDIRNTDHLPRGTGAPYLLCSRGPEGQGNVLIAKRWLRKRPLTLAYGEVLVDFTQQK